MLKAKIRNKRLILRRGLSNVLLLLCVAALIGGCARMPTESEMAYQREEHARSDLELLKPPPDVNFEQPLTLDDCIRFGLRNNLELRIAALDQEIADRETLAYKLQMLPGLDAEASYSYRDRLRKSDVYDWELDQDLPDTTVSELKDSGKASLTATWDVLDTVLAYVKSKQGEMREEVLDQQRRRQAQQLALDITQAYWQAAAMEDALDYVHVVEKRLKEIKSRIDASVVERRLDRMDAADIELRLKELEITIRQLQANLSSSRLELSRLMGLNQNVQYTLARPPLKPVVSGLPHTKELDIDRLEECALLRRPELFQRDIQVLIQKEEARSAVLRLFPGIRFFASTNYDDNRLLLSNTWNNVGAGIGWELLDLPSRIVRWKGTEKAIEMAEAQRLMMTAGVVTQVHIALLDYAIKVDRFKLLEEAYTLSSQLLDMARDKSSVGHLPELAVTQRQLEEMASKLRRDEAVVDLLVAHKRLCVSVGIDPLDCKSALTQCGGGGGELSEFASTAPLKKWKCTECGYIHTGTEPPDVCPVCGAGRDKFVEVPFGEEDLGATRGWADRSVRTPEEPLTRGVSSPGWAGDAADRFLWKVQLGAFTKPGGPEKRIAQIQDLDLRLMDNRDAVVTTKRVNGRLFNRVRAIGLTEEETRSLTQDLKRHGMEYWILPPNSAHW